MRIVNGYGGIDEQDPMGGFDPYSNSKGCSELVSAAYRSSYFSPDNYENHRVGLATARAGNVIGGGDWAADRLIPDIISGFLKGEAVYIRNPHSIRPWQHVLEPLRGYLMLAEKLNENAFKYSEAFNFGPHEQDAKSVEWIVADLAKRWGMGADWMNDKRIHPHEASYLKLDISKARSVLGWTPALTLGDALSLVVEWTKLYSAEHCVRDFTLHQIQQYQKSILK